MRKIMKLFLVLAEENKSVEEVQSLADAVFHTECRMEFDGQRLNKTRIMNDMEEKVKAKVTWELIKVEEDESCITYEYTVREPREKAHKMKASATVRDGKLFHVDITENLDSSLQADTNARRVSASVPVIPGH